MKTLYPLLCCVIALSSCTIDSLTEQPSGNDDVSYEISSLNNQNGSDCFSVTPSMLSKYLRLVIRGKSVESVEPMIEDGDTLAYYVQFANGKGWDLIAADSRITPLLVSSPDGSLDENSDPARIALGTLKHVKDVKQRRDATKQAIWGFIDNSTRFDRLLSQKQNATRGFAAGMWVPLDTIFVYDTITTPRLISTKWGQRYPWDSYTPIDSSDVLFRHSAVGCGPVAAGQILYKYLHQTTGLYSIPDQVSFLNGRPQFVSFTTNWSGFAESTSNTNTTERAKTAKFLSWLGHLSHTSYHYSSSSTYMSYISSVLGDCLNYRYLSFYNCDTVLNNLINNDPVLVSANSSLGGHAFIIDSYTHITYNYTIRYIFDSSFEYTEEMYHSLPSWLFEWPSPAQFPDWDPEKNPAILNNHYVLTDNTYILMNWGWSGSYDNNMYLAKSTNYLYDVDFITLLTSSNNTYGVYWEIPSENLTFTNVFDMLYGFRRKY